MTNYLLGNVLDDLARGLKTRPDQVKNKPPLPYLRSYYRLYKQTKDETKKQEILMKMKEIIGSNCTRFVLPKGLDKEVVEIFQLMGFQDSLLVEEIAEKALKVEAIKQKL